MRPERQDIAVPPFPPALEWVGGEPPAVERICARGPLLVHFIDAADLNSVRTLPYVREWRERYGGAGLTIVGVNSPRFPVTADLAKLTAALERHDLGFGVALDRDYEAWHAYGCEGWPSLFLWGQGGALRWFHFGEGDYRETEEAIQAELRALDGGLELPEPLEPLRPSDAPGVLVMPPSDEVFPGGSIAEPLEAADLELDYAAGGAYATLDGEGELRVRLDEAPERVVRVDAPGLYELARHRAHERHTLAIEASSGVLVYAISFAAGIP